VISSHIRREFLYRSAATIGGAMFVNFNGVAANAIGQRQRTAAEKIAEAPLPPEVEAAIKRSAQKLSCYQDAALASVCSIPVANIARRNYEDQLKKAINDTYANDPVLSDLEYAIGPGWSNLATNLVRVIGTGLITGPIISEIGSGTISAKIFPERIQKEMFKNPPKVAAAIDEVTNEFCERARKIGLGIGSGRLLFISSKNIGIKTTYYQTKELVLRARKELETKGTTTLEPSLHVSIYQLDLKDILPLEILNGNNKVFMTLTSSDEKGALQQEVIFIPNQDYKQAGVFLRGMNGEKKKDSPEIALPSGKFTLVINKFK